MWSSAGGNFGTVGTNPNGSAMDVEVVATGDAIVRTDSGALAFGGDLDVEGTTSSIIEATGGRRIDIGDSVYMDASGTENRAAGLVRVASVGAGSSVNIAGSLDLYAETYASGGSGANAINTGTAEIVANGGTITVGDDVVVYAGGYGGSSTAVGGNASGGTARIVSTDKGEIQIAGNADVEASGFAGRGTRGGSGAGGNASIVADGGGITIGGDADIFAAGFGEGGYGATSTGGIGAGGTATLEATSGTINVSGDIALQAEGRGGRAGTGGAATGGTATIRAGAGGTITGQRADIEARLRPVWRRRSGRRRDRWHRNP
jgi:hypothetical protein